MLIFLEKKLQENVRKKEKLLEIPLQENVYLPNGPANY